VSDWSGLGFDIRRHLYKHFIDGVFGDRAYELTMADVARDKRFMFVLALLLLVLSVFSVLLKLLV
jgi:hypothetical protein